MSSIVMLPTPEILRVADLIDQAIAQFLIASKSIPPLGKFESEVETMNLFILAIRDIESVLLLARTDLVLLPGAYVLSRAVFEIAVKAAWMIQPDDPFNREVRWLAHIREEERLREAIVKAAEKNGGNTAVLETHYRELRDFRMAVSQALPQAYSELSGNPGVEAMLETVNQKRMYSLYRLLAQYVHGGHASTGLYRKGLGTGKMGGEFIHAREWHLPLNTVWKNLRIFGEYLLEHLRAGTAEFLTQIEIDLIDRGLDQIGQHSESVY